MDRPSPQRLATKAAWIGGFTALCSVPLALRLAHPSLYSDDVTRIGQLQRTDSLRSILFEPFNEHMAPLFQAVSWITWHLCGRDVSRSALAFTLASYLPFILCVLALGILVRRELRSPLAALGASALLALSGSISETFAWYSASSFTWALLGTIVALDAAGRAADSRGIRKAGWLGVSALSAMLAPAGSGIGLLAGPAAAVRIATVRGRVGLLARAGSVAPMVGTAAYLAICSLFRYRDVLSQSLRERVDIAAALRNIGCVGVDVLIPGLFGVRSLEGIIPDALAIGLSSLFLIAALVWGWRSERRDLVLVGLSLILGGYAVTFGVRSYKGSDVALFLERYQLFPLVGLILLIALAARRWLARWQISPYKAGTIFAALLLASHLGMIRLHAKFFRWPDQPRTLAAIDHLGEVCRKEGITRDQAIAALDPVRTRWYDHPPLNALEMLPITAPRPTHPDAEVRSLLLGSLSPGEREALCGGMDASKYLQPLRSETAAISVGRLVRTFGLTTDPATGALRSRGWPAHVEFEMPPVSPSAATTLVLPLDGPSEVWWSDHDGGWSETRSVRISPQTPPGPSPWSLPLDRLPHWDSSRVKRLRIGLRKPGIIASGEPKLVR